MSEWKTKRFWKSVQVTEAPGGFAVMLDTRELRTPLKRPLVVPTRDMATAISAEWEAQQGEVRPDTMPNTRSANAAIDKVADQFDEVAAMIAAYADSDLICYRAEAPEELVARQADAWDPLLDWAAREYGAALRPRTGVMHLPQDREALRSLSDAVHAQSLFELTALHDLVGLSGSLVLGLAVTRGRLAAGRAWELSRIDEEWQIQQWGRDDEADRQAAIKQEAFQHAFRFHRMANSANST